MPRDEEAKATLAGLVEALNHVSDCIEECLPIHMARIRPAFKRAKDGQAIEKALADRLALMDALEEKCQTQDHLIECGNCGVENWLKVRHVTPEALSNARSGDVPDPCPYGDAACHRGEIACERCFVEYKPRSGDAAKDGGK